MLKEEKLSQQFQQAWSGCNDRRDSFHLAIALGRWFPISIDKIMPPVIALFDGMGLPLPARDSVMVATAGVMVFLDDYGLTIRIEKTDHWTGAHIADHPLMLGALLQRRLLPQVVLEICPGVHTTKDRALQRKFLKATNGSGIKMMDTQVANIGILPGSDQIVIIDRMAARHLEGFTALWQRIVARQLHHPQKALYGALQEAAEQAWRKDQALPDAAGLQKFMQLAQQAKQDGVLVSGWVNDDHMQPLYAANKPSMATAAGRAYAQQIEKKRQRSVDALTH